MNFKAICAFVLATTVVSCAHSPTVAPVTAVEQCGRTKVVDQLPKIITEVANDLASQDYFNLLVGIAGKYSWAVVDCAVMEILGESKAQMASSPSDVLAKTKASNAYNWLNRTPTHTISVNDRVPTPYIPGSALNDREQVWLGQ